MSVADKLVQVMLAVPGLTKDGTMQAQNYRYLSEEKVTGELNKAFAAARLTIRPIAMDIVSERETANGWQCARILVTYQLQDADDVAEAPVFIQSIGEGQDKGDKVMNKCMTAAYKYALRQTCMISTGDDPDHADQQSKQEPKQQKPTLAAIRQQLTREHTRVFGDIHDADNAKEWGAFMLVVANKKCAVADLAEADVLALLASLKPMPNKKVEAVN